MMTKEEALKMFAMYGAAWFGNSNNTMPSQLIAA